MAERKAQREMLISAFIKTSKDFGNYLKSVPKTWQFSFYKNFNGDTSLKNAIKCKCGDCTCFSRDEIAACEIKHCPLWRFRPYK